MIAEATPNVISKGVTPDEMDHRTFPIAAETFYFEVQITPPPQIGSEDETDAAIVEVRRGSEMFSLDDVLLEGERKDGQ